MDITIQREALLKPLQAINGIIEKKQTLPILSNVLLTVQPDKDNAEKKLSLTGTDYEIELVGFVAIESMINEGATTVSARKLFDICRVLPEGICLRLTLEKNYLVVRANESCFMLNTLPPQEFPQLEASNYPTQFMLKQHHLKNLLTRTYFAMGQQDVRHYLNGAFLDIQHQTIKCIAADGHRLALTSIQDESIHQVEAKIILPRKSVLELMRLLGDEAAPPATLCISDQRFRVITSDYIFTSKLINAQYPDYNRLIPRGTTIATGEREMIKQALIRASILLNEKFRGVRFQFEPNKLLITANNSDQEQAEEAVSLEYEGNKIEIGFNVAYLLDIVSAMTAKCIRCVFSDPNNGVLIESAENDHSLYVVMPMRL